MGPARAVCLVIRPDGIAGRDRVLEMLPGTFRAQVLDADGPD